jgi:hypothetical protein
MTRTYLLAAAIAASILSAPAQAAHYLFQYEADPSDSDPGSILLATLHITTSDTADSAGFHAITGVTGTVDGNAVDMLYPNPDAPGSTHFDNYIFDNEFVPGSGLSENGLLIGSGLMLYNFGFFDDGSGQNNHYYALSSAIGAPGRSVLASFGNGTIAAVPEPAQWTLMVAGFGLVGATLRRRRTTISFA